MQLELERQQARAEELASERDEALEGQRRWEATAESLRDELKATNESLSVVLPDDPRLPRCQFGPRFMSLCVNLAREVGLRASTRALTEFFRWLNVEVRIPTYQCIRIWMQRLGLGETQRIKKKKGRIWIVDHSNQIGQEKAFLILGVEPDKLPPVGKTLDQSRVEVLASIPGTSWKREDVAKVYADIAKKYGTPRAVLADGAVELRDSVELAKWPEKRRPIVLRDLKHYLANRLEAMLNNDADFALYVKEASQTRNAIQQTELGHLVPPSLKPKARFMNLQPLLNWGCMALWHAQHPDQVDQVKEKIDLERLEDKLGWIKKYAIPLERWSAWQQVVSTSVTWINQHGLYRGAASELRAALKDLPADADGKRLMTETIEFVRSHEKKLKKDERLWLSTEIIESVFATYKQFEGQHARGGFTQLLPTLGALLKRTTPQRVKQSFAKITVKELKEWIKTKLPDTIQAKRSRAYRRFRKATASITSQNYATIVAAVT